MGKKKISKETKRKFSKLTESVAKKSGAKLIKVEIKSK